MVRPGAVGAARKVHDLEGLPVRARASWNEDNQSHGRFDANHVPFNFFFFRNFSKLSERFDSTQGQ